MGIYDFGHGVRIPAGSLSTYANTSRTIIANLGSGLVVYNPDGPLQVQGITQLPLREQSVLRQFVMVGSVDKGRIEAEIGEVPWNVPRQYRPYAQLALLPTTPYEIPEARQKKIVVNIAPNSLVLNRINCYFVQVRFSCDVALSLEEALEVFYFEVYWDGVA